MKRLIVCADGTWKSEDDAERGEETNVVALRRAIAEVDAHGVKQDVHYTEGVGVGDLLTRVTGGAFGRGLEENILDGYRWLIARYSAGDEIYLFGFSRGAYTVRSLAGMIRKCGLLRTPDEPLLREAYDFYRDRSPETHPAEPIATAFRKKHSHEAAVKFIGVWDTVGSLGIPTRGPFGRRSRARHGFHDVRLSSTVRHAFQAVAVDERRKSFAPALWEVRESDLERDAAVQEIEQRWFAGVHSNVGGGYRNRDLSNLPLRWIAERARGCGLAFRDGFIEGIEGCERGELVNSLTFTYAILGAVEREIGAERRDAETGERMHTFEVLDESVGARRACLDLRPPYDPPNLRRYLERLGPEA